MFSWMPFFGTSSNTTWQAMLGQEADAGRQAFRGSRGMASSFLGPGASLWDGTGHETPAACSWSPSFMGVAQASVRAGSGSRRLALWPPFTPFPPLRSGPLLSLSFGSDSGVRCLYR